VILVAALIALSTAAGVASEHRFGAAAERSAAGVLTALLWVLS